MSSNANVRMALIAIAVYVADQLSKLAVVRNLPYADYVVVLEGFFRLVHWHNTGAAWSLFHGSNTLLAVVSLAALIVLIWGRKHFQPDSPTGQVALGLICGGILGNLTDRVRLGYVVDFLYFHLFRRGSGELGFPAFNLADSAICLGVGLLFLHSLRVESRLAKATAETATVSAEHDGPGR